MSSSQPSGLDSQQTSSHSSSTKLNEFEEKKDWSAVKSECIRYLRSWGFGKKAKSFEQCSKDYAVFECQECKNEFSAPITCGLRICPHCRSRIRGRLVEKLEDHVKDVKNHRHMVLTIPNLPKGSSIETIEEKIAELKENFGKFRRRKYFSDRVKGCIYGIEVKQVGNGYNLHLHVFLALEDWVKHPSQFKYKKIAGLWVDYFPNASKEAQEFRKHRDNKNALVEVVSYATKGAYFEDGKKMARWVVSTIGLKLVGRTGCFFDISIKRDKKYIECPYCKSKEVRYVGKWSELKNQDTSSVPPPTISQIEEEQEEGG